MRTHEAARAKARCAACHEAAKDLMTLQGLKKRNEYSELKSRALFLLLRHVVVESCASRLFFTLERLFGAPPSILPLARINIGE